jgi:glycosyltransferase involved in cell wall biosynthesis
MEADRRALRHHPSLGQTQIDDNFHQLETVAAFSMLTEVLMKILVLAYNVSPIRGSEYSVGWNYITEMAKSHELYVLYGLAGDHMGDFEEVDVERVERDYPTVKLFPVAPSHLCNALNYLNRTNIAPYSFYLAYREWHKLALRKAKTLDDMHDFDIVHYLSPIGFREPGYLWQLDKPYLWGPVGGVVPQRFCRPIASNFRSYIKVWLKNEVTRFQFRTSRRLLAALRRADLVLAATSETAKDLYVVHGVLCSVFAENGVRDADVASVARSRSCDNPFKIIWIGSLNIRKSPDLLLKALLEVRDLAWEMVFIGSGPLLDELKLFAAEHDLTDRVRFAGYIKRDAVLKELSFASVHVVTSMAEGNPTTIWEAMANNVPTLTLDHCGMHDTICERCGVKVPLGSYDAMATTIARELRRLITSRDVLDGLKRGVVECVKVHTWSKRAEQLELFMLQAIENYNEAKKLMHC